MTVHRFTSYRIKAHRWVQSCFTRKTRSLFGVVTRAALFNRFNANLDSRHCPGKRIRERAISASGPADLHPPFSAVQPQANFSSRFLCPLAVRSLVSFQVSGE